MDSTYTIRKARPSELESLSAIELAAARLLERHAPESILAESTHVDAFRAAQRNGHLWVAVRADVPVGFAIVRVLGNDSPHLDELDVHPSHGRRGIGAALVQTVCEWATHRGYAAVTLTTFREVAWNMPFYERMGFEEVPASEADRELLEIVADETARGLDPARRVIMRYECR